MKSLSFEVSPKNSKVYDKSKTEIVVWNLEEGSVPFQTFNELFSQEFGLSFERSVQVVEDPSVVAGYRLVSVNESLKDMENVIYAIVFEGKVLKIGKSKPRMQDRSYTAGTVKNWLKGTPSDTNYVWSQIFRKYSGSKNIEFWTIKAPAAMIKNLDGTISEGADLEKNESIVNDFARGMLTCESKDPRLVGDVDLLKKKK